MRTREALKVADEVWVATALLHREHPADTDFSVRDIVERARREAVDAPLRAGVYVHAAQHCVANRPPSPAKHRLLFETRPNRRRLYRVGDLHHPARHEGKCAPNIGDLPPRYRALLDWYDTEYVGRPSRASRVDPLLALRGSGKKVWAKEHADRYVRRLRAGWR
jgi:hypothetical protein